MTILVTGAAGFIGYHVALALLDRGDQVLGLDNLSAYYDPALKRARLDRLAGRNGFFFETLDLARRDEIAAFGRKHPEITRIVHLAAQAGVRHSLEHPFDYVDANLTGHLAILELGRFLPKLENLVYASSSSVYGGNSRLPFSTSDRTDDPVSLYAATKKAGELMASAYTRLYGIAAVGLRFFTVYGPWGRPDMSAFLFTKAILEGRPIQVFNNGDMRRDFTYVDDIVQGVLAALDRPVKAHRVYNLGNNRAEPLLRFIEMIEKAADRKAIIELKPMQKGDVKETFADILDSTRDLGFRPTTPIDVGIPRFVEWYLSYYKV
ncbi:MAG: NAD-dependent epimerase/dehydratase family protein [Alphaproteobacteria bacterium]|nr:NAD-dependent epimerase/dehydratase family protein [Alphaproteobacteria bacterium]